jgi:predicted nucleic acid-binding protein
LVKVLFDTSVLVAALIVTHPQHAICLPQLKAAESKQVEGFISTTVLSSASMIVYSIKCPTIKAIAYHFTREKIMGEAKLNLTNFIEPLQMFWCQRHIKAG